MNTIFGSNFEDINHLRCPLDAIRSIFIAFADDRIYEMTSERVARAAFGCVIDSPDKLWKLCEQTTDTLVRTVFDAQVSLIASFSSERIFGGKRIKLWNRRLWHVTKIYYFPWRLPCVWWRERKEKTKKEIIRNRFNDPISDGFFASFNLKLKCAVSAATLT